MSHKQKCIDTCKEHLQSRNLLYTFDESIFNHYYRKNNGGMGNSMIIGLKTADMMIELYKPIPADMEIYDRLLN
jgi:hypothetical protein